MISNIKGRSGEFNITESFTLWTLYDTEYRLTERLDFYKHIAIEGRLKKLLYVDVKYCGYKLARVFCPNHIRMTPISQSLELFDGSVLSIEEMNPLC